MMLCSNCGHSAQGNERFCRQCGTQLSDSALIPIEKAKYLSKDPDELTGNGIGSVIVGDGFLIVAVLLSVAGGSIGSLLWLLLLIPAFFFFGKGFADVLHARQIRRRLKQAGESDPSLISPARVEGLPISNSGELALPSITERTTRNLK